MMGKIPALGITVAIAALFFLYVGTEASIGGWAAEHTKRLARHPNSLSTDCANVFLRRNHGRTRRGDLDSGAGYAKSE